MQQNDNPLLANADRAVFTFNMHNLTESCFNHVFKKSQIKDNTQINKD